MLIHKNTNKHRKKMGNECKYCKNQPAKEKQLEINGTIPNIITKEDPQLINLNTNLTPILMYKTYIIYTNKIRYLY